uniref:NOT4p n=1 Tax=Ganoderma boninense TaxID=34458 RepID=A0A5K1K295_9APHY|nr:NOT4p [Ganoderma boninense]
MRITALTLILAAISCALAKHGDKTGEDADDDDVRTSSPTSTSTSTAPSPTPSSLFQFLPPSNTTTCSNTVLQWQSTDISAPLTLTITNERATAGGTPSGAGTPLVSRTLATNVSAAAGQFAWRTVDVPAGAYVAVAFDTARTAGIFVQSPSFFVQDGSDERCLASDSSSSSSAPTATSAAAASSSSGSSSGGTGAGTGAQEKTLSPGVLGGVVASVVVGVLLLILAVTFPHYWKETLIQRRRNRHPGGPYHLF